MNFRVNPQKTINFGELIVDNFAGGGGASTGIEQAVDRPVDIAVNHDEVAIAMHEVNHPGTTHYIENVWDIDPRTVTKSMPVGLAWFSPDCRHHSKAKGGKPVSRRVRGLAWIVLKWAGLVRPRVIMLENVEEFEKWGPLTRSKRPCKKRYGMIFSKFVSQLEDLGYQVEWKQLRACDYGAPTIRKRLFLVARCDGLPIVWPAPTHGPGLIPYRTAADIIDWSLPCPSIFDRKKPLAEATLRRIAEGIRRFVIESGDPFIVNLTHGGRLEPLHKPVNTITGANRGEKALVTAHVSRQFGKSVGNAAIDPVGTITAGGGGKTQLVQAFLAKHYTGVIGHKPDQPLGTITQQDHHSLVTAHLTEFANASHQRNFDVGDPLRTQCASTKGGHFALVQSFLMKYYGTGGQWQRVDEPIHTISTKARLGLVTVQGVDYQIVDIGMRMLQPHELYAAQGFPTNYVFDRDAHGNPFTKTEQIAKCGNSVCPPVVEALVRANYSESQTDIFSLANQIR